ncbi:MAG TPA: hypothetical protein VEX15_16195 [Nocardioidaceae bacterium]|nr:hypothetical protein [Nocardioidaceae bacterium]
MQLQDVANGYLAWAVPESKGDTVVSRDPDADRPRFGQVAADKLSPGADYISGVRSTGDGWRTVIVDRAANEEVELAMPAYREWYVMQWIGDDRFTAMGYDAEDYEGAAGDAPELLTCDIAAGDAPELLTCDIAAAACTVVGQTSGGYIIHPDGQDYW